MLLQYMGVFTIADAVSPQACGYLRFSFIYGSLSGKLHVSSSVRGCISSRSAPRLSRLKARLKLGRTIVCRTPSKRLPHWASSPFWQHVGGHPLLRLKKKSSLSIQRRLHPSLSLTASTANDGGARAVRRAPFSSAPVSGAGLC